MGINIGDVAGGRRGQTEISLGTNRAQRAGHHACHHLRIQNNLAEEESVFYTVAVATGGEAIRSVRGNLEAMPSDTHTDKTDRNTKGGENNNTGKCVKSFENVFEHVTNCRNA